MIRILADTSTLYSTAEGKEKNIIITPLSVSLDNQTYREFDEICSKQFLDMLKNGSMPVSSQQSIGDKMDIYACYANDEIIDLTIADGLSGTYQSACMARSEQPHAKHIHVVNTTTLCGPHRYLVQKAIKLVEQGIGCEEILAALQESINDNISFLIPQDYSFLKRGGRLTPAAAALGGLLKLVAIMTQTSDGSRLEKYAVKRTWKGAMEEMLKCFKERGINQDYYISVSHADNLERAEYVKSIVEKELQCEVEILELSPVFITQGGPGCVALQAIKR